MVQRIADGGQAVNGSVGGSNHAEDQGKKTDYKEMSMAMIFWLS